MVVLIVFLIIIGCFITYALLNLFDKYGTGIVYEMQTRGRTGDLGYLQNAWAEFFNEERFMSAYGGMPYKVIFKYYGGTWIIVHSSELYWVCSSFNGIEKESPQYKSSWNYWRSDFKSMKYIMENHPNLIDVRKNLTPKDKKPLRA